MVVGLLGGGGVGHAYGANERGPDMAWKSKDEKGISVVENLSVRTT